MAWFLAPLLISTSDEVALRYEVRPPSSFDTLTRTNEPARCSLPLCDRTIFDQMDLSLCSFFRVCAVPRSSHGVFVYKPFHYPKRSVHLLLQSTAKRTKYNHYCTVQKN